MTESVAQPPTAPEELRDAPFVVDGDQKRLLSVRGGSILSAASADAPAEMWMPVSHVCCVEIEPAGRKRTLRLHCLRPDENHNAPPKYEAHDLRSTAVANPETAENPDWWAHGLKEIVKRQNGDPALRAPVLVLINPFSGKRKGQWTWSNKCAPIFQAAGLRYEVVVTREAGEAKRIASEVPLGQYSCIACVGGDGILCEVTNGLMSRPDWEQAVAQSMLPVAPIPSGTANATTHTLYRTPDPAASVCHILLNNVRKIDMFLATQPAMQHYIWGVLSVNCGIVSDVDFGSECIRFLGNMRTSIWAVLKILGVRTYRCRLTYLPGVVPRQQWWGHVCHPQCEICNRQQQPANPQDGIIDGHASDEDTDTEQRQEQAYASGDDVEMNAAPQEPAPQMAQQQQQQMSAEDIERERVASTRSLTAGENWAGLMPSQYAQLFPAEMHTQETWQTRELSHTFLSLCKQAWLDPEINAAPYCHPCDGCMDVVCLEAEHSYRSKMIRLFGAMQNGSHVQFEHLLYLKARAFTIESLDEYEYFGIDGEKVPRSPTSVFVAQSLLPVLCTY